MICNFFNLYSIFFLILLFHNIFIRRWVNSSHLLCCFLKKGSNVSVSFHNSRLKSSGKNTRQLAKLTIERNLELRKDGDGRGVSPRELRKDWRVAISLAGDGGSPGLQARRSDRRCRCADGGSPDSTGRRDRRQSRRRAIQPAFNRFGARPAQLQRTGGNPLRVTASVANTKGTGQRTACFF